MNYFKENFLTTHDLFPMINLNSGLGQSFATLYYYGVYSPMTVVYILWPLKNLLFFTGFYIFFIIIIQSIVALYILKTEVKDKFILAVGVCIISFSGLFLYYSSTQMMFFQSFLGFLFIILGINRLMYKNKYYFIIIGVAFVLMINYTFIVQYLFYALIYVAYLIVKLEMNFKEVLKKFITFVICTIIALLISSFVLFPQLAMSGNRSEELMLSKNLFLDYSNDVLYSSLFFLFIWMLVVFSKKISTIVLVVGVSLVFFISPLVSALQLFLDYGDAKVFLGSPLIMGIAFVVLFEEIKSNKMYLQLFITIISAFVAYVNITLGFVLLILGIFLSKFNINKKIIYVSYLLFGFLVIIFQYKFIYILKTIVNFHFSEFVKLSTLLSIIILIFALLIYTFTKFKYVAWILLVFFIITTQIGGLKLRPVKSVASTTDTTATIYENFRGNTEKVKDQTKFITNIDKASPNQYLSLANESFIDHFTETIDYNKNNQAYFYQYFDNSYTFNTQYAIKGNLVTNPKPIAYIAKNTYSDAQYESFDRSSKLYYESKATFVPNSTNKVEEDIDKYLVLEKDKVSLDEFLSSVATKETQMIDVESNVINTYKMENKYGSGDLVITGEYDGLYKEKGIDSKITINESSSWIVAKEKKARKIDNLLTMYVGLKENENITIKSEYEFLKKEDLEINFKNFKVYFIPKEAINNSMEDYQEVENFKVNLNKGYEFDTNCDSECYVATTIPYDKGFTVKIDDKIVGPVKVNKDFLGVKVNSGKHHVIIEYKIPHFFLFFTISLLGIIILTGLIIYNKIKNKM